MEPHLTKKFTRSWACAQLVTLSKEAWYQDMRKEINLSTSAKLEETVTKFKNGRVYSYEAPQLHTAWVDLPLVTQPKRPRKRKAKEEKTDKTKTRADANDVSADANQQLILAALKTLQENQHEMQAKLTKLHEHVLSI
eukprot:CAMPEP_0184664200 /NCGR_PEP_ID=MMETSP0308-20130426/51706_1 /TAXON_ID=38269 /ORGANISM="Gloeochaete witrockiana, Strain SAG 46.84" /LENGTH=137 /DNA_ID=CAMNT_0027107431 /DNA_START=36 /DNA_END=446 /DNA_ORIENTATION=-